MSNAVMAVATNAQAHRRERPDSLLFLRCVFSRGLTAAQLLQSQIVLLHAAISRGAHVVLLPAPTLAAIAALCGLFAFK